MNKEKTKKADDRVIPMLNKDIPNLSEFQARCLSTPYKDKSEQKNIESTSLSRVVAIYDLGSHTMVPFEIMELQSVLYFDVHEYLHCQDLRRLVKSQRKQSVLQYIDEHFDEIAKLTTDIKNGRTVATLAIGVVKTNNDPKNINDNGNRHNDL